MFHPIIELNDCKIEDTFLYTDELNLNQLANELCRFIDRAAPRVAYHFAEEYISSRQYDEETVSGELSIFIGEKRVSCIVREVKFDGTECTADKLTQLEYEVRTWMMKELASAVLYSKNCYDA